MKYLISILFTLCILLALNGCKQATDVVDDKGTQLNFNTIYQNSRMIINDKSFNIVIKSKEEALKFISETPTNSIDGNGKPIQITLPEIDFADEMFIAVSSGFSSSGSHKILINSVYEYGNKIYVEVRLYKPSIGTDDIGHPFHMIRLKKSNKIVEFSEIKEIKEIEMKLSNLNGSSWKWMSFIDESGTKLSLKDYAFFKEEPYFKSENFTLNFKSDSQIDGRSGCNQWYAIYNGDSLNIKLSSMVSTKVACFMTTEYMNALNDSYKYEIINNKELVLYCKSDFQIKTLFFERTN